MKRLLLASLCLFAAVGCGGSGSNPTSPPLAGTYTGTWVNVADDTDTGTSFWTIDENGTIDGTDTDDGDEGVYTVTGEIDAAGNVEATTRLGEDSDPLIGRLRFDAQNRLTGNLVWDGVPRATYRYTFTRAIPN